MQIIYYVREKGQKERKRETKIYPGGTIVSHVVEC